MESKIYLNVIKTLTPTYIDLISSWSAGECTMSNLLTFERILSICLRDGIIEDNELYQKTEKDLGTHEHYQENDPVDHMEFNLWLITYEQIMRDEGLIGNTGTGEDDKDKESVFFDPFITPFVHKKGAEVSLEPADSDDTDEDGADEESPEEDRTEDDSEDDQETQDGGKSEDSDHPETEEEESEEEQVQEEDQGEESSDEFQSVAFNLDKLESEKVEAEEESEEVDQSTDEPVEQANEETVDDEEEDYVEQPKETPYVPVEEDIFIKRMDSDTGEPLPTSNIVHSEYASRENPALVHLFDEFGKPVDIRPIVMGMREKSDEETIEQVNEDTSEPVEDEPVEPVNEETIETNKPASTGMREAEDI